VLNASLGFMSIVVNILFQDFQFTVISYCCNCYYCYPSIRKSLLRLLLLLLQDSRVPVVTAAVFDTVNALVLKVY
jgi:hypothetical protein